MFEDIVKRIKAIERELDILKSFDVPKSGPTFLLVPLTSTAWDGDAYSTTAKTLIDLSAVFGVPAGVKAVDVSVKINDSGSAGGDYYLILDCTSIANQGRRVRCSGLPNDSPTNGHMIVPCDANGDIYHQIAASGAGTMDIVIQIWSYFL
jgi:hypothetical protein